jgi:hypothetical protein
MYDAISDSIAAASSTGLVGVAAFFMCHSSHAKTRRLNPPRERILRQNFRSSWGSTERRPPSRPRRGNVRVNMIYHTHQIGRAIGVRFGKEVSELERNTVVNLQPVPRSGRAHARSPDVPSRSS